MNPYRGVLLGVLTVGFILGAANPGYGNPLLMGLVWVAATFLGGLLGMGLFMIFMEVAFSRDESDSIGTNAGTKLLGLFFLVGAIAAWVGMYYGI